MSRPPVPEQPPSPFSQCPSGCVCGVRELVAKAHEHGPREAEDVDANEMRALLSAVRNGYETIRTDPRIPDRRHAAESAYEKAESRLNVLQTTLDEKQIAEAAETVARKTEIREASRGRPTWLRVVRWPTVAAVGLFDVYYFKKVFEYLTSGTGDGGETHGFFASAWESLAATVPGIALAITIAASGEMLIPPLRSWKAAALRRSGTSGKNEEEVKTGARIGAWLARFTWWLLPVLFVGTLLLVIGIWAGLRGKPHPEEDPGYLMYVSLLIVMISLGAMAVKVLASDRPAEELAAARRTLWWRRRLYLHHSREADKLIGAYESAWRDLRTLRDDLIGLLRIKMLSAWEGFVLRVRALHRMAGNVTAADPSGTAPDSQHAILPEFEGIPQPQMELGSLHEICRLVQDRPPTALRDRKRALDAEYARQVTRGRSKAPSPPRDNLPALP